MGGFKRDWIYRWTKVIQYEIGPDLYDYKSVITSVLDWISSRSCLTFVKGERGDRIKFSSFGDDHNDGNGCWSYVGRQGGEQVVNLAIPGCVGKGTVFHEVFHALGKVHEQSRPDRDDYVEVLMKTSNQTDQTSLLNPLLRSSTLLERGMTSKVSCITLQRLFPRMGRRRLGQKIEIKALDESKSLPGWTCMNSTMHTDTRLRVLTQMATFVQARRFSFTEVWAASTRLAAGKRAGALQLTWLRCRLESEAQVESARQAPTCPPSTRSAAPMRSTSPTQMEVRRVALDSRAVIS